MAPIDVAWVSQGGTGAQNYDEFNSYDEIAAVVRANPSSILAVDMPHCTPADLAAGHTFLDALPAAPERLARLKAAGRFARSDDVLVPYRTTTPRGAAYGVWAMVSTAEISASAETPGRVIRNEDVFADKVRERTALTETLGHLVSAVLLLLPECGDQLVDLLRDWTDARPPASVDVDQLGREHAVWLMGRSPERDRLLGLLGTGELIVADGNHRSLAAQQAGLDRFLAVVTAPTSLTIAPYNRLLRELGMPVHDFVSRLQATGFDVRPLDAPVDVPSGRGRVGLYVQGSSYDVVLPAVEGTVVDRLDHTVVERALLGGVLGLNPGDDRIAYVGGDSGPEWLRGEVDAGRAEAAILVAPVSTDDFVRVNRERMKMPRKSTWFTPKARAGLVLAELPPRWHS